MAWTRRHAAHAATALLAAPLLVVVGPSASEVARSEATGTPISGYGSNAGNSGLGKGNGGGDGTSPKTFTISGQVADLAPGVVRSLFLTVENPNKQALSITGLGASAVSASRNGELVPACAPSPDTVLIGTWPGGRFTVPAGTSVTSPVAIPVVMPNSAPDECQGVTFSLSYSGTAVAA